MMSAEFSPSPDARVEAALGELRASILERYPDARFRVTVGEDDTAIVQLVATVDVDDTDQVHDVVMDRVLRLQDKGFPIFVVTERPIERTIRLIETARLAGEATSAIPRG